MPNWCQNYIRITGPKEKIEALWETAEETDGEFGLFSAMRPEPNYDEVTVYETYVFNEQDAKERPVSETPWYDWRLQNWSCKWNPSEDHDLDCFENGDEAEITGWFHTAWGPALKAYDFFIKNNPDCSIHAKYYEGGNDFMGTWEDGEGDYIDSITNLINKGEKNWTYNERDLMDFFGILEEEWRFEEDEEEND